MCSLELSTVNPAAEKLFARAVYVHFLTIIIQE
jgi:hypothetical protein